ncbi:MAG TPA: cytochrome c peroxidase [Chitinophagaceae bacterium]|nr:cytochrome c peroxidase [Chitinophagaceae bacterium]
MKKGIVLTSLTALLFIAACNKKSVVENEYLNDTPTLPATPDNYQGRFESVVHFQASLNNDLATLGRVLFYDRKLSANNTVSCGSCHEQSKAFADGKQFSSGLALMKTPRNTPAICNAEMQSHYFWDGRVDNLKDMVTKPIENHIEMGVADLGMIVNKLSAVDYYKPLIKKVFGDEQVTKERIALGLQEFVKSIVSFETKNDKMFSMQDFTLEERVGRQLFMTSLPCASCHNNDNALNGWKGSQFANIGLEETYTDKGAVDVIGPGTEGFFKIPSLKNIALTAPYMHDGRFKTLEEVIDFYTQNVTPHAQLSGNLMTGSWTGGGGIIVGPFNPGGDDPIAAKMAEVKSNFGKSFGEPLRFELSEYQKKCLVAYLKTFTDKEMITNPMYADPFRK